MGRSYGDRTLLTLRQRYNDAVKALTAESLHQLREWPARLKSITDDTGAYQVRDERRAAVLSQIRGRPGRPGISRWP